MLLQRWTCPTCGTAGNIKGFCQHCDNEKPRTESLLYSAPTIREEGVSWGSAFRIAVAMAVVFSAVGLVGGCMTFALMSG